VRQINRVGLLVDRLISGVGQGLRGGGAALPLESTKCGGPSVHSRAQAAFAQRHMAAFVVRYSRLPASGAHLPHVP
jgi:hypothetical protein